MMPAPSVRYILPAALSIHALVILSGCGSPVNRVHLTTYDQRGNPQLHYADFSLAAFHHTPEGLLQLILRGEHPSSLDPTQTITQILYVREIWNPHPGKTYAEKTQINAHVQYAILTPPTGLRLDGSAFVYYDIKRGRVQGEIETGQVLPLYHIGEISDPFVSARISGEFMAVENPAEVVNTVQELESMFAPQPAEIPAPHE